MEQNKINQLNDRINKELQSGCYAGYAGFGACEWHEYDWVTIKAFIIGSLLLSIGRGDFESEVGRVLNIAFSWNEYQVKKLELKRKYKLV